MPLFEEIKDRKTPFIIAEAGVNHNGSLDLAKKLIDIAVKAGADSVKFQTFKPEELVTKKAKSAEYQTENIGKKESQLEMLQRLALPYEDFIKLKEYCDQKGIMFSSTPHTEESVEFLAPLIKFFKVGSGDLTNIPILKKIAKYNKPIILSTGMATMEEISEAINSIEEEGNKKIILLHCTTNYPTPIEQVNLNAMSTMEKKFNYPIGYSDHTEGIQVPVIATILGAKVIEKHFTLDKDMEGPDHKASLTPEELSEMIKQIKNIKTILGSKEKIPLESELDIAKVARKSIVANQNISKGTTITEDLIIIKRPGTGIQPKNLRNVLGKIAKEDIKQDEQIRFEKLI